RVSRDCARQLDPRTPALSPALWRGRARPGVADDGAHLYVGRRRDLRLGPLAAADASAALAQRPARFRLSQLSGLSQLSDPVRCGPGHRPLARARAHPLRDEGARRGRQSAHGAIGRHQHLAPFCADLCLGQRPRRSRRRPRRRPPGDQPELRARQSRLFPDCRRGRRARQHPRPIHRGRADRHRRYRLQIPAPRIGGVLHLRSDNGTPVMATEGLVRPRLKPAPRAPLAPQQAIDAFARRHRYRWWEALPWAAAIAAYVLFPSYLPLGAQILATILFALSADLVLGYAGIVTLGHAAFFGTGAYTAGFLAVHGWGEPITGLLAGTTAAGLAGTAGALIAQTTGFVGLSFLNLERSGGVLIMLIIGGVGRLYGAFIGVPLYMIAQNRFSEIEPVYWYFWIGLLMVLVV